MKKQLVDFIISNPGHHAAMMKPIIVQLTEKGYRCRLLSLCEFRGLDTPISMFDIPGVDSIRMVPFQFRSPTTGHRHSQNGTVSNTRSLMRTLSWKLLLYWQFMYRWLRKPDLIVTPNDGAFPYDEIAKLIRSKKIPFLLVQEGIKFRFTKYGTGNPTAAALWGEGSIPFFLHQGIPSERIFLTGNPRFDEIWIKNWRAEAEKNHLERYFDKKVLLFLSNPIDDLGVCSGEEKLNLVHSFIEGISLLFEDPNFRLIVKLHRRESVTEFQSLVSKFQFSDRITVMRHEPLYPLFFIADAAVMFASSAGLEALLFNIPLGVLELPEIGFLHDFVEKGAANGIKWENSIADQVSALLSEQGKRNEKAAAYRKYVLAVREDSTGHIVELIEKLLDGSEK